MSHGHCHDEHEHGAGGDGHGHGHGHSHDHSDDLVPALQNHIYDQIDFSAVRALNERDEGSGRKILQKTWAQRSDPQPEICSDADEQLIVHIPFTAQVRLHSLHITTSPSTSAPKTLHVYLNEDTLDFNNIADATPVQTFALSQTSEVQDINVKRQLYNNTRSLTLFFEDNFGDGEEDETRISYLGFKGDWIKLSREPVDVLYESAARPTDHKVAGKVGAGMGAHGLDGGGRQGF